MNDLLPSALRGDAAALEGLLEQLWPRCYRLAAAVIGDRSLAQDAAQEACAVVYTKLRTLRNPAAFDAWLYRIVMREASRVRRRLAPDAQLYDDRGFTHDGSVGLDVWQALRQLPLVQRDVVVLFYFHDLRSEDIASILGVPHVTVRTRLNRARQRLRELLGDYVHDVRASESEMKHYAV